MILFIHIQTEAAPEGSVEYPPLWRQVMTIQTIDETNSKSPEKNRGIQIPEKSSKANDYPSQCRSSEAHGSQAGSQL